MIGTATKNTIGLWCKKLRVKALKGSFMIWVKAISETLVSNNRRKEKHSRMKMKLLMKRDTLQKKL
jgi:hypothetical protein